jgi:hypothetical protein
LITWGMLQRLDKTKNKKPKNQPYSMTDPLTPTNTWYMRSKFSKVRECAGFIYCFTSERMSNPKVLR